MKKEKITVQVTVQADIRKVWEYWTNPEHIIQWNAASDDWHCPKAVNDLRPGGKFSFTMAARDGSMSFDLEGVYDRVVEGKVIAYTMSDGRQVVVNHEDMAGSTVVTEIFDPEDVNPADLQKAGWQAILDNFKKYTEAK